MRQSDIFFVLPFALHVLYELRRNRLRLAAFALGIALVASWYVIHNYVHFGNPLTTGYKYNLARQYIPKLLHPENFPAGFIGLLFSPSLGMLTMAPVTLFAFPGLIGILRPLREEIETKPDGVRIERRLPRSYLQRVMLIGAPFVMVHIVFYSCYLEWWGGWSYCYRYLIDIQPLLALGTGWFFRPDAAFYKLRWPLYIPALLLSVSVQFYGAFLWGGSNLHLADMPRFYLNLDPQKGSKGIFNHEKFFYSWKRSDHIILGELSNGFPSRKTIYEALAAPKEVWRDLFDTRIYDFRQGSIIIYYGRRPPGA
jgi:hypothetical protein